MEVCARSLFSVHQNEKRPSVLLAAIGIPSNPADSKLRDAIRTEGWLAEYSLRWMRYEFVIGSMDASGRRTRVGDSLRRELSQRDDIIVVNAREPLRNPIDGKCAPAEKMIAWLRVASIRYDAEYFVKVDIDTWLNAPKFETNLMHYHASHQMKTIGNSLWSSFSIANFAPCGFGSGPKHALGTRKECTRLEGVDRVDQIIGPFPFHIGAFYVIRRAFVREILENEFVYDFVANASLRFRPPYWVRGEDVGLGLFAHLTDPAAGGTHWGWSIIHDIQCPTPSFTQSNISSRTIAVHNVQRCRWPLERVRAEMRLHNNTDIEAMELTSIQNICVKVPTACRPSHFPTLPRYDCRLILGKYPQEKLTAMKRSNVTCVARRIV